MIICDFEPKSCSFANENKNKEEYEERNSLCAMLATATCATAQNGNSRHRSFADSIQTEKDSIKADKETEIMLKGG